MSATETGQQTAGRPRSEEAHQAILDATLELLVEVGFSALTVEGVAGRAGVGKATIYRRWPSKLPLVVEAFSQLPALEEVDTGNLVDDLTQMLRGYLQLFNSTPLGAVLLQARLAPELESVGHEIERVLSRVIEVSTTRLAICASHDLALAQLRDRLACREGLK